MSKITIERFSSVNVLRDDLLVGGTKSILMPSIIGKAQEYVYASPVYGGFQIALAAYCKKVGKKATIFCAKRRVKHINTLECIKYGAKIIEVPYGYLSVVEKKARDYCDKNGAEKIVFGGNSEENKELIAKRMRSVIKKLGKEPIHIWCAVGSGTLVESILMATTKAKVHGVRVGAEYSNKHERLTLYQYPKPFDKPSTYRRDFPSTINYDLKAWEFCNMHKRGKGVFFWNVL